jgi:hypothetical protein
MEADKDCRDGSGQLNVTYRMAARMGMGWSQKKKNGEEKGVHAAAKQAHSTLPHDIYQSPLS